MKRFIHFRNWSLKLKLGVFFIGVAALPLLAVSLINFVTQRQQIIEQMSSLLSARADEVTSALDVFNQGYLRATSRLTYIPEIIQYVQAPPLHRRVTTQAITALLMAWKIPDRNLWGEGIIDPSGTIIAATEKSLIGHNIMFQTYVKDVLHGSSVISDLHFASPLVGSIPTVAYASPFKDSSGKVVGAVVLWVKASALWKILEDRNEKAGIKSFSVMFDQYGIRIGHSYNPEIVFHPGGKLESAVIEKMVAEQRFGENTRLMLDAPREFPDQFSRAKAASLDNNVFLGFAPVNQLWNYGVGHRLKTVPWTLFYMIPEHSLDAPVNTLSNRLIVVGIITILIALVIGGVIAHGILKPITTVALAAESFGKGLLSTRSTVNTGDEIGRLSVGFNTMAEQIEALISAEKLTHLHLQQAVLEYTAFAEKVGAGDLTARLSTGDDGLIERLGSALNQMAGNLSEFAVQLKTGASVLNTAASEIFSTTTQVASGSVETATAIEQTTSTVGEVKQTAVMASQKAKLVSDSAHNAAQLSLSGRKSVEMVVQGMTHIQEQMSLIAESVMHLSEQSRVIGEIVTTVNDLSEQSNLLAVNAAIEAAKVGEQGKGFAVVAQEIKELAKQSRQATAQIRIILDDIQKATTEVVLVTEQGDKAVGVGMKQSLDTDEWIRMLADSIDGATQAASQIAVSSQQQMVGMDQVAMAMDNIRQASVHNVAGTRQVEAAARDLQDLGQKLSQLVERYRV